MKKNLIIILCLASVLRISLLSAATNVKVEDTKNDANKINVLAYNVQLLDAPGKGSAPGRPTRAKLIPDFVKAYDVVVFSEAFDEDARKFLMEGLKRVGFVNSTCILGSGLHQERPINQKQGKAYNQPAIINFQSPDSFKGKALYAYSGTRELPGIPGARASLKKDGGVLIVSKYPIVKTKEYIYSAPPLGTIHLTTDINWDWMANKGVLYAQIIKDNRPYHIFGTHTQAQYKKMTDAMKKELKQTGINQIKQMAAFIKDQHIPNTDPVIMAGDFNINQFREDQRDMYQTLKSQLNALVPELVGKQNSSGNDMSGKPSTITTTPSRIDYVLVHQNYAKPVKAFNSFMIIATEKPWDKEGRHSLSDHEGMYGYIEFEE